jgi:hypothetical protein
MTQATIYSRDVTEVKPHWFVAEASQLGWRPGYWPELVETTMGNGSPFLRRAPSQGGWIYHQANGGLVVHVLND